MFGQRITGNESCGVYPFGDPRIKGYVPLPEDYRSLSRPSSAPSAKASTVRPYHLLLQDLMILGIHTIVLLIYQQIDAIFAEK